MTRTLSDAALMLRVMEGPHARDPFSLPSSRIDYDATLCRPIDGLKIAYSPDMGLFPIEREVERVVREAVQAFESAGATVDQVTMDLDRSQEELSQLWVRQMSVLYAEIVEVFKPTGIDLWGGHRDDLTPELAQMIELGLGQTALQYKMDDGIRTEVFVAVQDVFEEYDLLVTPTLAIVSVDNAADGNTVGPNEVNGQSVDPCIGWCLTYPINFTGYPAASIPAGLSRSGLPIGMQLIGRRFDDATVLAASAVFEQIRPWHSTYFDLECKRAETAR